MGWGRRTTRTPARPAVRSANEAASQAAKWATVGRAASSASPQNPSKRRNRKNDRNDDRTVRIDPGENRCRNDVIKRRHVGRRKAAGVDWVRAKGGPDKPPDEPSAVAQRLRAQAARTSLVVRVRLDQTVDGPRAVKGHGMLLSGQSGPKEHPDYAESWEPLSSCKPLFQQALESEPLNRLRIVLSSV